MFDENIVKKLFIKFIVNTKC